VKLFVDLALTLDVFPNHVFVAMLPNRACEITIRPKLPTPQLLLHLRASLEYLSRGQAFYQLHELCHTIGRNRLHQKMNMVLVRANLQKLHLIPICDLKTDLLQYFVYVGIDNRSPIFRRKHQVIQQYRNIVALMNVLAHEPILRRKRRGIGPEKAIKKKAWFRRKNRRGLSWLKLLPESTRSSNAHGRIKKVLTGRLGFKNLNLSFSRKIDSFAQDPARLLRRMEAH